MQLTTLGNQPQKHHVFNFKLTGLKQEYGLNAIAVVMDKFDGLRSQDDIPSAPMDWESHPGATREPPGYLDRLAVQVDAELDALRADVRAFITQISS